MAAGTPVWSSRFAFIMASVGFAVGLGNIWRFPYVTGENGGGAFVIVYLLCVFAIGVPCVMAELLVGRRVREEAELHCGRPDGRGDTRTCHALGQHIADLCGTPIDPISY